MTLDIDKLEAAAKASLDAEEDLRFLTPQAVLELIARLREAERDAALYLHTLKHIKHSMTQAGVLGNDKAREIKLTLAMCNAAMKESA